MKQCNALRNIQEVLKPFLANDHILCAPENSVFRGCKVETLTRNVLNRSSSCLGQTKISFGPSMNTLFHLLKITI